MPRITTVCPTCGVVDLDGDEVTLVVNPLERTAWYVFDCLGCARQVAKAANSAVVTALTRLEVPVLTVPAEALETTRESGSLSMDDLLDLLLALRTTEDVVGHAVDVRSDSATQPASA